MRKHSKAMWWIIILVIVVAFVFWDTAGRGGGGGGGGLGSMNGHKITPTMYENARNEVLLYHLFATGDFPGRSSRSIPGFNVERETYNRIFVILKAQELGIQVSDELAGKVAAERLRAIGGGRPISYADFEAQVLARERLTAADFARFIRHDLAIQQLVASIGLSGQMVAPAEIEALYRREHQEVAAEVAFFHGASNRAAVVVTPEKLGEFYTNQMARYRLPERAVVSYVYFPLSNFMAQGEQKLTQMTNLNELLEEHLGQLGTNYTSLGATPEAAKARMREDYLKNAALMAANEEAKKFDNQLYDLTAPLTPGVFVKLAQGAGLTPQVSAPFARGEAPAGMEIGANFARTAFNLSTEEPLAEPLVGEEGIYVVAYNHHLPSEQPTFDSVKAKVTADFQTMETIRLAGLAGRAFQEMATNGLAAGQSFADLCARQGVTPVKLPPLALSTRSVPVAEEMVDLSVLKRAVFATKPGHVSPVIPSADGVAVVYVAAEIPLNEAQMRTNLPAFTREVHQVRRGEAFNEWFRREAEQAYRTVPYFQREAQLQSAAAN
ncbi:MAG TPA: SurA N-terminal domain-containing protein [Verrucomicrobiota bacterium]|nr:SurA N-terminal domain-containing protein [Verrucomicrobiota bacterium]HNT13752.1 SurA N-terminal domain-containing protein [Verrucomicrobiota bacterium]